MPNFSNFDDLYKYVNKKYKTNDRVRVGSTLVDSERDALRILTEEARRLEFFLKKYIKEYLEVTYPDPKVYVRTNDWWNSIRVGRPMKVGVAEYKIDIFFDRDLADHPSVIASDQPDGYVPWLMEVGWDIRDKMPFEAEWFTHHRGSHYIRKAVDAFNQKNEHDIMITVTLDGEIYIRE